MKFKQPYFIALCFSTFLGLAVGFACLEFNQPTTTFESVLTLTPGEQAPPHGFSYRDFYLDKAGVANHTLALQSSAMINKLVDDPIIQKILLLEKQFLPSAIVNDNPKLRLAQALKTTTGPTPNQITLTVTDYNPTLAYELSKAVPQLYGATLKKQLESRLTSKKIKDEVLNTIHQDNSAATFFPQLYVENQHQILAAAPRLKTTVFAALPSLFGLSGLAGAIVGLFILVVVNQIRRVRLYQRYQKTV